MGAERWIVFLVLASLGGGIYIMSYLVDEESIQRYGERVADYNAQHHETMMDAALHRAKRGPAVDAGLNQPIESKYDSGNAHINDAGMVDHPFSENDRIMRARISGEDVDSERAERSDYQGTNVKELYQENPRAGINQLVTHVGSQQMKDAGSSGMVAHPLSVIGRVMTAKLIDGVDLDSGRAQRSADHGAMEEKPDQEVARIRRSSGQGISEKDPGHPLEQTTLFRESSGHVMNQQDLDPRHKIAIYEKSSMQGSQTEDQDHRNPAGIADLYASNEDNDAREQMLSSNKLVKNQKIDVSSDEFENADLMWKLEHSSGESHEESDKIDPKDWMSYSGNHDDLVHLSRHLLMSDDEKKLITFNKGIDFILGLMSSLFSLEGEVSVPLPDLNKTFGHGIMQGRFEASRGFFENPATLHRTGDVAIVKNGDSVGLEVALGLATLAAGYNHYDLKILKIHQNGTLDVSIAENSIKMKISLTYYPHCKVDVNYLELDKLGGIKVDINGLGAFQSMFNMLSKWILDNFTNDFRNIVNKKLIEKAEKAVARQDICKYFPLNLL